MARRRRRGWLSDEDRKDLLFVVGVGLIVWEIVVRHGKDGAMVLAFLAAMAGIPFFAGLVLRGFDDKEPGDDQK